MTAPLVGKRVVVEGLASKPELNGSKGTATSFDDAKGRYNVKMDAGGMAWRSSPPTYCRGRR